MADSTQDPIRERTALVLGWDLARTRSELARLIGLQVLGAYRSVEVTELFACACGGAPFNVLSVLVLEERPPDLEGGPPRLLNTSRIKVAGFHDLSFGVSGLAPL